ncbi:MAG: N-acetyl-gamma-glutamyl-phosphate reductase [Clostridia bacterium]|nr:N-acetyl-gamma-glutamyl-phosphate reductase [Clostridia bacterium]
MKTVFIDGSAGTTGLRIRERLAARGDLSVLVLPEERRKDPACRKDALNRADLSFLCLPDDAAREAAAMAAPEAVLIDTSTAHRTSPRWTYGFPELSGQREKIASSRRIANPGCHASGFIALAAPLVSAGVLDPAAVLTAFSLTGYSGGGKKMIAAYEAPDRDGLLNAPRMYGLGQTHKHLPEMKAVCGLEKDPVFCPVVAPFYAGMEVIVPVTPDVLSASMADVEEIYRAYYASGLVRFTPSAGEDGFLSAGAFSGRDDMEVTVLGNPDRILLVSRFDNLGKGASGSAIQNMNLVFGLPEETGLITEVNP